MKNMEENYCLCALNRIFGFSPKTAHALLAVSGSAKALFEMSGKDLDFLLGPYSKYRGAINPQILDESATELDRLSAMNISFTGCTEDDYPELLRECADAPVGLYIRSSTPASGIFASSRRISVVGTRDISPYGMEWCRRIVLELGRYPEKPVIVSGLALGTDICAHEAALEAGLKTIAVMATGPERIYPYRHRDFAERLTHTPGCALISDYPPGTPPLAVHFLRRNRIIAGLSEATVLIESRIRGGGMMTSRMAFSYDREVFALPGRIDDPRSQGCNSLIRSKTAEPITDVSDIPASIGLGRLKADTSESTQDLLSRTYGDRLYGDRLRETEEILSLIRRNRGIDLDSIASVTGMEYSRVAEITSSLDMEGLISKDLLQRCSYNVRK